VDKFGEVPTLWLIASEYPNLSRSAGFDAIAQTDQYKAELAAARALDDRTMHFRKQLGGQFKVSFGDSSSYCDFFQKEKASQGGTLHRREPLHQWIVAARNLMLSGNGGVIVDFIDDISDGGKGKQAAD
jgi:hypothetical protein